MYAVVLLLSRCTSKHICGNLIASLSQNCTFLLPLLRLCLVRAHQFASSDSLFSSECPEASSSSSSSSSAAAAAAALLSPESTTTELFLGCRRCRRGRRCRRFRWCDCRRWGRLQGGEEVERGVSKGHVLVMLPAVELGPISRLYEFPHVARKGHPAKLYSAP